MNELNDEQIIEELLKTQLMLEEEIQIKNLVDSTMEELESEDFMPVFDEYFSGALFTSIESKFEDFEEDETKGTNPCWDGYEQVGMKKGRGGKMVPNCVPIEEKSLDKWFKEKWVDISRPKEGGGFEPCGRNDAKTGKYPKCVPASKAASMSKEEIASAVRRKRKAESTEKRVDKKPINVSTSAKSLEEFDNSDIETKSAIPDNPELYARVKAAAKKKFDVYPSAYANAWLVREYKRRGGTYKTGTKSIDATENECCPDLDTKAEKKKLRDPNGGLTAAGRAHFNRTEGSNLKPGVKGPADTPEKMRRKGSFLTRFFTNPSGPMVDEKGRATRLALSAAAWGERVPKNASDAAALAEKGRKLLKQYHGIKKKEDSLIVEEKALGASIGQMAGGGGADADEAIDHDGDGNVFDGTENEQPKPNQPKDKKPYKPMDNAYLEKRRRRHVQRELASRGIKPTQGNQLQDYEYDDGSIQTQVYGRPQKERDARAEARETFDQDKDRKRFVRNQLKKQGITANAKKEDRDDKERAARKAARAEYDRRVNAGAPKKKPTSSAPPPPKTKPPYPDGYEPGKPADRYPDPPKPRDAEAERMERLRPKPRDQKPADRYPSPSKPRDAEAERMERLRPKKKFKPRGTGRNFGEMV